MKDYVILVNAINCRFKFKNPMRSQSPKQDFCYTVYVTAAIYVTEYKLWDEAGRNFARMAYEYIDIKKKQVTRDNHY